MARGKRCKNHNNFSRKPLNDLEPSVTDSRQDSIRSIAIRNTHGGIGGGSNGRNTNPLSSSGGYAGRSIHSRQYSIILGGQHSSHVFNANDMAVRNQSTSQSLYNYNQYSGHGARLSPSPEPGAVNRRGLSPKISPKASANGHSHGIGGSNDKLGVDYLNETNERSNDWA